MILDSGLYAYMESPRYCTGYAALFGTRFYDRNTYVETFSERVQSTYEFLNVISTYLNQYGSEIKARANAFNNDAKQITFPLDWHLDTTKFEPIDFMGYEAEFYTSEVTGLETYRYNRKNHGPKRSTTTTNTFRQFR